MSNDTKTVNVSGIGLGGAAFLVLLVLKVMGHIDLHWFWVLTSVLWLPVICTLAVFGLIAAFAGLVFVVVWAVEKLQKAINK